MATTTNYAWSTPDDTALVSAGASAMRTLGSAIDATLGGQKNIKQIVSASYSTVTSSSSTTYATTNVTATITPSKNTNDVLVVACIGGLLKTAGNVGNAVDLQLNRGATVLASHLGGGYTGSLLINQATSDTFVYLDSPATTSATTYTVNFRNAVAAASVSVQNGSSKSVIYLLEIGV